MANAVLQHKSLLILMTSRVGERAFVDTVTVC